MSGRVAIPVPARGFDPAKVSVEGCLTTHATERYRERVADVSVAAVVAALDTPAIRLALCIGARAVRLPSGHRAVIKDGAIVTITPAKGLFI